MLKNFKKIIIIALFTLAPLLLTSGGSILAHHCLGHADGSEGASGNIAECLDAGACLDTAGQGGNCQDADTLGGSVDGLVKTVINVLSYVVGIVSVIMIIIGGLKYITSGGDSGNVTSAKNTILYAIIGLVIVVFAQIIVRFVLNKATASNSDTETSQIQTIKQSEASLYRLV